MTAPSTMKMAKPPEQNPPKMDKNGVVKVDIEGEVIRMAERAKVEIKDLTKEYVTTHYEIFEGAVRQYYKGVDDGTIIGAKMALDQAITWRGVLAIYLAGLATYPVLKLVFKVTVFLVHLYNS